MFSAGDKLRDAYTADLANKINALLSSNGPRLSAAGKAVIANGRKGSQLYIPPSTRPVSTIQGILTGGAAASVSDGTVILDPCAWTAYSIQAGYFVLAAGTSTLSVLVNATAVSWLNALAISSAPTKVFIANPAPDLTHVIASGSKLSIELTGSSGNAAGLSFSLNCPY